MLPKTYKILSGLFLILLLTVSGLALLLLLGPRLHPVSTFSRFCRSNESALPGTTWTPVTMGTVADRVTIKVPELHFDEEGNRFYGTADECWNSYRGSYCASGREIAFSSTSITLISCLNDSEWASGENGKMYFSALANAHTYSLNAESLIIYYAENSLLYFVPAPSQDITIQNSTD